MTHDLNVEWNNLLVKYPLVLPNDFNHGIILHFSTLYPHAASEHFEAYVAANKPLFQWGKPKSSEPTFKNITEQQIIELWESSPELARTQKNWKLVVDFLAHNPDSNVNQLRAFISGNKDFDWIALPKQLRGDAKDKLYQVDVPIDPRAGNKMEQSSWVNDIKTTFRTQAEKAEHRRRVEEARATAVYLPDGRLNHSKTIEAKRKALAELGIVE